MKIDEILIKSAENALGIQNQDGSFPKGSNGPWNNEDTFVRTTAHWCILLYKAYQLTSNEDYMNSSYRALKYLQLKKNVPFGFTFYCRTSKSKNKCNSLIGQAWAIEPFIYIGICENDYALLEFARGVVKKHEYSYFDHLWKAIEINGDDLGLFYTINQQIWFSVLAYTIGVNVNDDEMIKKSLDFFNHFIDYMPYIYGINGLISHKIIIGQNKNLKDKISSKISFFSNKKQLLKLSNGYLSFILYGLAILFENYPNLELWNNLELKKKITDSLTYSIKNINKLSTTKDDYKWAYNPTGIEIAYALQCFNEYCDIPECNAKIIKSLNLQFKNYFNCKSYMLNENTKYPNILSSRIYECVRLNNYDIDI
jgi:hypothetical protein